MSVGCSSTKETGTKGEGYEIALVTDVGDIDDKSFNQGAWEGVEKYAKDNGKTYKYYKPVEKSDTAYISSIDQAIKAGAKIVVCPGYLFEVPVFKSQSKYKDVKFIILDGVPNDGVRTSDKQPTFKTEENTQAILYAEEEAGFLAGYAAVKDGYKNLGFMGGVALPAVVKFGYGYLQGADVAAKELGLKKGDIKVDYTYVGNFLATPENMAKASSWYNDGTELIFACGGAVGNSVMKAAETAGKSVIGVDVDQSAESKTVITSAMKNLRKSVYDAVDSHYKGSFIGGKTVVFDVKVEGVGLPFENSKFKTFNKESYNSIYEKLVKGEFKIKKDTDAKDVSELNLEIVNVNLIK
ncbi:MAG: BMP family ABC transporter substrate-binding protein [Clostridium sp.]